MDVYTLELLILLYLHKTINSHPRAVSRQATLANLTTDPWPGNNRGKNCKEKIVEEQNSNFIKDSLPELLSLLSGHLDNYDNEKKIEKQKPSVVNSAGVIKREIIIAIGFIIGGSFNDQRSEMDLIDLATNKQSCYQSGYLTKKQAFQKGLFEQWLMSSLDCVPHRQWRSDRKGKQQNCPTVSLCPQSIHSISLSPYSGLGRLLCINDLNEGMTVQTEEAAFCDLKITNCTKSSIYIMEPLHHVTIQKCFDTKIVLGPVGGRIKLSECRNISITCPSRSFIIHNCQQLEVYTLVPQRPLLVGTKTHTITVAPLNIHYPKLKHHLNEVGLQTVINLWNKPLHIGPDGSAITSSFEIMSPDDFHLIAPPFTSSLSDWKPPLIPPGLPSSYFKTIETASLNVSSFRDEVKEANLSAEQESRLQKAVDLRFKKWLKETGKHRELEQLQKLDLHLKPENISHSTAI